ncbi:MAG: hypothetical protein OXU61_12550, partial [Gammaproteobacteria bacterium]|nr:hypothetical protein [Gammaproteobacteria bacterium]
MYATPDSASLFSVIVTDVVAATYDAENPVTGSALLSVGPPSSPSGTVMAKFDADRTGSFSSA